MTEFSWSIDMLSMFTELASLVLVELMIASTGSVIIGTPRWFLLWPMAAAEIEMENDGDGGKLKAPVDSEVMDRQNN